MIVAAAATQVVTVTVIVAHRGVEHSSRVVVVATTITIIVATALSGVVGGGGHRAMVVVVVMMLLMLLLLLLHRNDSRVQWQGLRLCRDGRVPDGGGNEAGHGAGQGLLRVNGDGGTERDVRAEAVDDLGGHHGRLGTHHRVLGTLLAALRRLGRGHADGQRGTAFGERGDRDGPDGRAQVQFRKGAATTAAAGAGRRRLCHVGANRLLLIVVVVVVFLGESIPGRSTASATATASGHHIAFHCANVADPVTTHGLWGPSLRRPTIGHWCFVLQSGGRELEQVARAVNRTMKRWGGTKAELTMGWGIEWICLAEDIGIPKAPVGV